MEKLVIIINGKPGSGKDTLCELAAKHYKVKIISAITPIKDIAKENGWDGVKDEKSRKLLSDLKHIFIKYNDLPNKYLLSKYQEFVKDKETEILFVHIREADEIKKFKQQIDGDCVTLLIKRPSVDSAVIGNDSDDKVDAMNYDYYFVNNESISRIEDKFVEFIAQLLKDVKIANIINGQADFVAKIQNAIKAIDADDVYSCGMRNGMRWCLSLFVDKEPLYEKCKSMQSKYEPVTAEDFARTMSLTSAYSYMVWYSEVLSLMERTGFVICKKTM